MRLSYGMNQFPKLKIYVEDARLDIDNNMAEFFKK